MENCCFEWKYLMVSLSSIFFLLYPSDCGHNGLQAELSITKFCVACAVGDKRKAMIKELAAFYRNECQSYCRQLLTLQRQWRQVKILWSYWDPLQDS
jgi:hypothetical protein